MAPASYGATNFFKAVAIQPIDLGLARAPMARWLRRYRQGVAGVVSDSEKARWFAKFPLLGPPIAEPQSMIGVSAS